MRARTILLPLFVIALGAFARPVRAQSLADVAKKEGERRKEVKEPTKTFTNKDLPNAPVPSTSSAPSKDKTDADAGDAAPKSGDAAAAAKDAKDPKDAAGAGADDVKDEKYWSGRMQGLREALDRDQVLSDAVQSRINALSADFVNRDDPAQRNVIEQNRQKALDELERLKKAAEADTKAIDDLQEDARRAGVPSGWLR